jgi:hypothetical protein
MPARIVTNGQLRTLLGARSCQATDYSYLGCPPPLVVVLVVVSPVSGVEEETLPASSASS